MRPPFHGIGSCRLTTADAILSIHAVRNEDACEPVAEEPLLSSSIPVGSVVAADPDSLSGKARKARDYGIPIVGEAWLAERYA